MSNNKSSFILGSLLIFLGNAIGAGSEFLTRTLMANQLGAANYGSIILALSVFNIASMVALLGIHGGVAREIPRTDSISDTIFAALIIIFPFSILLAITVVMVSGKLSYYLNGGDLLQMLIILFCVAIPLRAISQTVVGVLRGMELAQGRVISWNLGYSGTVVILLFLGITFGVEIDKLAFAWIFACVVSLLISILYLIEKTKELSIQFNIRRTLSRSKPLLSISIPLFLSSSIWLFMENFDNFLIGYYLDSSQVGIYDSAFTIGRVFLILTGTVGFLFVPRFSKYHSNGNIEKMIFLYQQSTKWLTFIALPIFFFFLLYSKWILNIAFGTEYTAGSTAMILISIGFLVHVLLGVTTGALTAIGKTTALSAASFIALGVNLAMNIFLIPEFGIEGAAFASSLSYAIVNVFWIGILYRITTVQPFSSDIIFPICLFGIYLFIYIISKEIALLSDAMRLILLLSFISLFLILVITVGTSQRELRYITNNLKSL